jgi:hypothetical protein
MRKKFLILIILLIFFIVNFSPFFVVFAQTPTPTYAPFEDTNPENVNYPGLVDKLINNSGMKCGEIGQICCGREISPEVSNLTDSITGIVFAIFPAGFIAKSGLSIILNNALKTIVNPMVSKLFNWPSMFFHFEKRGYCVAGYPSNELNPDQCTCVSSKNLSAAKLCGVLTNNNEQNQCFNQCMKDGGGVWTGLGCFSSDLSTIIRDKVFGWGIGLAGMISLFCILYAAFQIQTSSGNAEKVKKAQELLTSCIMGLMLIIFSVFILKLIGVNILRLPGFK